jgi:alcohol dehydrogenase class IV
VVKFDFLTPTRILFGSGTLSDAPGLMQGLGSRVFVITGRHPARAHPLIQLLETHGLNVVTFATDGEPTIAIVRDGASACRAAGAEVVIGFGGGSALDAAKAIAALATNPGKPLDYLEVIGKGQPLTQVPLPFVAIPTTAGTGSEVTKNAVLASPEHAVKASLRHPAMLARVAIVDPALTVDLPPDITATTGMDALTQCIEAYVCIKATPLTDGFSAEGIRRAAVSLKTAVATGTNLKARTDISLASLYSGIALANAGLGAVHGFAGPLGGMFPAPHGAVCAALLPHVMEANLRALDTREPGNPTIRRFTDVARWLTQDPSASKSDGIQWLKRTTAELKIPCLARWGVTSSDIPKIIPKAVAASSMKGNPAKLTDDELAGILEAAL